MLQWIKYSALTVLGASLLACMSPARAEKDSLREYYDIDRIVLTSREGWSLIGEGTSERSGLDMTLYAARVVRVESEGAPLYLMYAKQKWSDGENIIVMYSARPWECRDERGIVTIETVLRYSNWGSGGFRNDKSYGILNGNSLLDAAARRICRFGAAKYEGY